MKRTLLGLLLGTMTFSCASKTDVLRPKEGTAGEATGERVCDAKRVGGDSEPFAVDWSDSSRASLESAMSRGIAVVKYSCEGVEVLKGCSVVGDYAYRGISKKTKVVQMKDMGSVAANLGPVSLPVAVEAEMKQGKGLDLAYAMVGNEATTVQTVSRDMLKGRCDGATHFVYEASLGAFALDTNASGEARAAAQVFGQGGVKTEGASSKSARTTDGDLQACDRATDEARAKTDGCKAVVRVTLFSIAAAGGPATASLAPPDTRSCPAGFSYVDGACEKNAKTVALCSPGDVDGCRTQCQAGSSESCGRFSSALIQSSFNKLYLIDNEKRPKVASLLKGLDAPLRAACDKGEGAACTAGALAAITTRKGIPDFTPDGSDAAAILPLYTKGCKAGDTISCNEIASIYGDGFLAAEKVSPVPRDVRKMVDLIGVGCDRGNAIACLLLSGQLINDNKSGMAADERAKLILKYARRACVGGVKEGCVVAAAVQQPTPQSAETFKTERPLFARGNAIMKAFTDLEDQCPSVASATSPDGAREMFEIACKRGDAFSCSKK
jgi:hypothetical protein